MLLNSTLSVREALDLSHGEAREKGFLIDAFITSFKDFTTLAGIEGSKVIYTEVAFPDIKYQGMEISSPSGKYCVIPDYNMTEGSVACFGSKVSQKSAYLSFLADKTLTEWT
jgi:hypothetical protein